MVRILRNSVMVTVAVAALAANIFLDLVNPWIAAAVSLTVAYGAGLLVERLVVERSYDEMRRLYGKDWAR